jgi:hypothetical protein
MGKASEGAKHSGARTPRQGVRPARTGLRKVTGGKRPGTARRGR